MSIKESFFNLVEQLKFSPYSKKEIELGTLSDTTQTSTENETENPYISYNPFTSYSMNSVGLDATLGINKNESIMRWRQAAYWPEVEQAISEICNDAIVYDEIEPPIKLNLSDIDVPDIIKNEIQNSWDKILYMLDFNEKGDEHFRQWYIDGQLNVESVYDNNRMREGIKKLIILTPFNFNKVQTQAGEIQYFYGDSEESKNKIKDGTKIFKEEQITHINSGVPSLNKKFFVSYLNPAVKVMNQLNLIEDSLVIARITRAPERYKFLIQTGKLAETKKAQYLETIKNSFRQKRIYNLDSGQIENRSRTLSVQEDFWFSRDSNGVGHDVELLQGSSPGFTSFEDLDHFVNKVYKSLKIPISRRAPDQRFTINNQVDIEKDELKFFKMILKLRRRFNNLFVDLIKKDVLARKVMSLDDWIRIQEKIKFTYSNSNEYSEIKNNQILDMRLSTANNATTLKDGGYIDKEYIQKKILRLTEDEIKIIEQNNLIDDDPNSEETDDTPFSRPEVRLDRNKRDSIPTGKFSSEVEEIPSVIPEPVVGSLSKESQTSGKKENIITETINPIILKNLKNGDVITDGVNQLKMVNGKLEKVQ